jgi:hypothetical protein
MKYNPITIKNLKDKFPELNSIDRSINKYARALMTEIPTIKKVWNGFAHLHYKPDMYTNGYVRCTNSFLEKAIEDQELPEDWKKCAYIIEFNTPGDFAKIYPNTQDWYNRKDKTIFVRMSKNWDEYLVSRDEMETWETKTVRKFNMVKHKNGETSELECFVSVNLVGLLVEHNKHNIELKRKGGKQGLKVRMVFDHAEGYKEDIKDSILDTYKICAAKYGFTKGYKTFYRMMKALENGKCLSLLAPDGKMSVDCFLLDDVHNYKQTYGMINNGLNMHLNNIQKSLFIVMDTSPKNNSEKNPPETEEKPLTPMERWPENYKVHYPPRKTSKKYLEVISHLYEEPVNE